MIVTVWSVCFSGAVGSLSALLPSLATRENSKELVFHMLVVLRSLSDSSGSEMWNVQYIHYRVRYPPATESENKILHGIHIHHGVGCRGELLQKGAVDILNSLLQYCDEKGILILLKVVICIHGSNVLIQIQSISVHQ